MCIYIPFYIYIYNIYVYIEYLCIDNIQLYRTIWPRLGRARKERIAFRKSMRDKLAVLFTKYLKLHLKRIVII